MLTGSLKGEQSDFALIHGSCYGIRRHLNVEVPSSNFLSWMTAK
jgi:hypothetical protein